MNTHTNGIQTAHDNLIASQEDDSDTVINSYYEDRDRCTGFSDAIKATIVPALYDNRQIPVLIRIVDQLRIDSMLSYGNYHEGSKEAREFAKMNEIALRFLHQDAMTGRKIDIDLYKIRKLQNKQTKTVSIGLLTPGTVFEYQLHRKDSPVKTATVKLLLCNGYKSWVVETVEEEANVCFNNEIRPITFNIQYITRVIKHVPGRLLTERDMAMRSIYYLADPIRHNGKYYQATSTSGLIHALIVQMGLRFDLNERVDLKSFVSFLWEQGVFKTIQNSEWYSIATAQKKRLRRLVRQNFNHFKVSQAKMLEEDIEEKRQEMENYRDDLYGADDLED